MPRSATVGIICDPCSARLSRAISLIPDLIAHVRAHVVPGASGQEKVLRKGKHSPAPLSLDAVDAADRLYAELVGWARVAGDDLHLSLPDIHGWTPTGSGGQVAGLKPGGYGEAVLLAKLLLAQSERIAGQPWAPDIVTELSTQVFRVERAWPMEERPTYLPTPCGHCDSISLVRYAPTWAGGHSTISCRRIECGEAVEPVMYAWHARKILAEKQAEERARVA